MTGHDKAIEAACRVVWVQDEGYPIFGKDRGDWIKYEPTVRRAVTAFLRAWAVEIQGWDTVTPSNLYFAANLENAADELEGKT